MATKPETQTLYVVQEVYWFYDDERYCPNIREGTELCKAFRSRKNAEVYRDQLLAEHWIEIGGPVSEMWELEETTSLMAGQLAQRLLALEVFGDQEPRTAEGDLQPVWDDPDWWSHDFAELPDETQRAICQLFDKAQKFEIVEMEMDLPVDSEGGQP